MSESADIRFVVTADQKSSRTGDDAVPGLLRHLEEARTLAPRGPLLPFERTAGDEVQALFADADAVVDAVVQLLRQEQWWVGVGIGPVDGQPPSSARAGRGAAYLAAREAVESAKTTPAGICVIAGRPPAQPSARRAEAAAWLLASLLGRRTPEGWEVAELMDRGARQVDVAAKLGISPQAVSRRLRVAGWAEERRGRELLGWLLARAAIEGAAIEGAAVEGAR
jgi:hypothetical protein